MKKMSLFLFLLGFLVPFFAHTQDNNNEWEKDLKRKRIIRLQEEMNFSFESASKLFNLLNSLDREMQEMMEKSINKFSHENIKMIYEHAMNLQENDFKKMVRLLKVWHKYKCPLPLLFLVLKKEYSHRRCVFVAMSGEDYPVEKLQKNKLSEEGFVGVNPQELYVKMVDESVTMTLEGIHEFSWKLPQIIAFLSYRRYLIAEKLGHTPLEEFGLLRQFEDSKLRHVTSLNHESFKKYKMEERSKEFILNPPKDVTAFDGSKESCRIYGIPFVSGMEANFQGIEIIGKIEGIPGVAFLSTLVYSHKRIKQSEYEDIFGYKDDAIRILHSKKYQINFALKILYKKYENLIGSNLDQNTSIEGIAKFHWWFIHLMPFSRGSASIGEMLIKVLLKHNKTKVKRWKEEVSPDLEVFLSASEDEYVRKFKDFLL